MIENRRDLLYEHPDDVEACPYLNRDQATGVILWLSKDDASKPSRERRNSREYDFFIASPSAPEAALGACGELNFGLLVWRFDERIFVDGYRFNEVNIDERQKSLRILEASGDYEIGDWRLPGPGFFGDGYNDPFRFGYKTELGARTVPNNWNNDWAHTGWEITDIQESPPESHTVFVRAADGIPGWPRPLPAGADTLLLDVQSALVAPITGVGPGLVCSDETGILAFGPGVDRWQLHRGGVRPASLAYHPRLDPADGAGTLAALDSVAVWLWDATFGKATRPGFGAGSHFRFRVAPANVWCSSTPVRAPPAVWPRRASGPGCDSMRSAWWPTLSTWIRRDAKRIRSSDRSEPGVASRSDSCRRQSPPSVRSPAAWRAALHTGSMRPTPCCWSRQDSSRPAPHTHNW